MTFVQESTLRVLVVSNTFFAAALGKAMCMRCIVDL